MRGPVPKPAHLRQRRNRKPGAGLIETPLTPQVPPLPNPDGRTWHPLTVTAWQHAWCSPMASQWLPADEIGLGRLALLWDAFYTAPDAAMLGEARLLEQKFGMAPLDRARLQWTVRWSARTTNAPSSPLEPQP